MHLLMILNHRCSFSWADGFAQSFPSQVLQPQTCKPSSVQAKREQCLAKQKSRYGRVVKPLTTLEQGVSVYSQQSTVDSGHLLLCRAHWRMDTCTSSETPKFKNIAGIANTWWMLRDKVWQVQHNPFLMIIWVPRKLQKSASLWTQMHPHLHQMMFY